MKNVAVVVEDEPSAQLLEEMEVEPGDTLYGLYQRHAADRARLGLRQCAARIASRSTSGRSRSRVRDDEEIRDCVAETVIHEFGHYFGMTEDQIEEIEEKFWRGESIDQA